jgi:hypothetical protein
MGFGRVEDGIINSLHTAAEVAAGREEGGQPLSVFLYKLIQIKSWGTHLF